MAARRRAWRADLGFPVWQEEVRSALVFGRPRAVDHELYLNLHLLAVVFALDALQRETTSEQAGGDMRRHLKGRDARCSRSDKQLCG